MAWNCRFREFFVLNLNNRPPKVVAGTASAPEEINFEQRGGLLEGSTGAADVPLHNP